jgi:hypothetical protein
MKRARAVDCYQVAPHSLRPATQDFGRPHDPAQVFATKLVRVWICPQFYSSNLISEALFCSFQSILIATKGPSKTHANSKPRPIAQAAQWIGSLLTAN